MDEVKRIFTFWEPKENIPGYILFESGRVDW